jgi:hypothetical protein
MIQGYEGNLTWTENWPEYPGDRGYGDDCPFLAIREYTIRLVFKALFLWRFVGWSGLLSFVNNRLVVRVIRFGRHMCIEGE